MGKGRRYIRDADGGPRCENRTFTVCVCSIREGAVCDFDIEIVHEDWKTEISSKLHGALEEDGTRVVPRKAKDIASDGICKKFQSASCFRGRACKFFHICMICYENDLVAQPPSCSQDCWSKI